MAIQSLPPTCLSSKKHDDRVLDVTLHYFGCLKASQQEKYFLSLPQKSKKRIVEEKLRIRRTRSYLETHPKSESGLTLQKFKSSLGNWRRLTRRREPETSRPWPLDSTPDESVDCDIKAGMMYFKDSRPYTLPSFDNEFPNQKITIKQLLSEDEESNPLISHVLRI